jgi:ADP-heptose:LPS heptosyltransferase
MPPGQGHAAASERPPGSLKGRRVLVLRNDGIGDLILALPLVQMLKDAGAQVGLLVGTRTAELLRHDRRVDRLLVDGADAPAAVKAGRFDTALVLWANWRNAWIPLRAGIARRLGPSLRPYAWMFTQRLDLRRGRGWTHESELNCAYGRALGLGSRVPAPRLDLAPGARVRGRAWLRKHGPQGPGPLVLLHPGSRGSAQPWPPERFAGLGRELKRRHGARILVTGGPGDEAVARACAGALGRGTALCLDLGLEDFAGLVAGADLFAAVSTGPLHLAAALSVPVLGLYPPLRAMSPLRWGPRGSRRAVLSPAGLGFRAPALEGVNYLERLSVEEAAAACGFLLAPASRKHA